MKYSEITAKDTSELATIDGEIRRDMFNMRFQRANGELKDSSQFRKKRRDIARVQTALSVIKNKNIQ